MEREFRASGERVQLLAQLSACPTSSHSGLPAPQQRASIPAAPGFVAAHEAPGHGFAIALLSLQIIHLPPEIEPDNGIIGTMTLRLGFIAEWGQNLPNRLTNVARIGERGSQTNRDCSTN